MSVYVDGLQNRKALIAWLIANAAVTVECLPEDLQIEGNAVASGDDEFDRETCAWIRSELDSGNEWAWCQVRVTMHYMGHEAEACLGGCSYRSEAEFRSDAYYADMTSECAVDLVAQLCAARETLQRIWDLATRSLPQTDETDR